MRSRDLQSSARFKTCLLFRTWRSADSHCGCVKVCGNPIDRHQKLVPLAYDIEGLEHGCVVAIKTSLADENRLAELCQVGKLDVIGRLFAQERQRLAERA